MHHRLQPDEQSVVCQGKFLIGEENNFYIYSPCDFNNYKKLNDLLRWRISDGTTWKSGFTATSSADNWIHFVSGTYWYGLNEITTINNLNSSNEFFWVNNSGDFEQCTDFSCIENPQEYIDGILFINN